MVLQEAAQAVGRPPDISVGDATYSCGCAVAAGHSECAQIQRFTGQAEAQAAFDEARGDNSVQCFNGYPAYEWTYAEHPGDSLPMNHRGQCWQADRWLITAEAFDDTLHLIGPLPEVSQAICQSAIEYYLFPAGTTCQLPTPP